jgi:regulator of sirC expression with transglutaminase-like and TPR domain
MRLVEELWSGADEAAAAGLRPAVDADDLLSALLLVEGADERDAAETRSRIERWGARLRADLGDQASARETAEAMRRLLGDQLGFRGQRDDYYALDGCLLAATVRRRRGMPITLSAVWMLVGAQAGVDVAGVGMPAHFIARVGGKRGVFIDPWDGGAIRSPRECRAIAARLVGEQVSVSADLLRPVSCEAIVERVLRNIANVHQRGGQPTGVYRASRMLTALRPTSAEAFLLRGRLAETLGMPAEACTMYDKVIALDPGTLEADRARSFRDAVGGQTWLVN